MTSAPTIDLYVQPAYSSAPSRFIAHADLEAERFVRGVSELRSGSRIVVALTDAFYRLGQIYSRITGISLEFGQPVLDELSHLELPGNYDGQPVLYRGRFNLEGTEHQDDLGFKIKMEPQEAAGQLKPVYSSEMVRI